MRTLGKAKKKDKYNYLRFERGYKKDETSQLIGLFIMTIIAGLFVYVLIDGLEKGAL